MSTTSASKLQLIQNRPPRLCRDSLGATGLVQVVHEDALCRAPATGGRPRSRPRRTRLRAAGSAPAWAPWAPHPRTPWPQATPGYRPPERLLTLRTLAGLHRQRRDRSGRRKLRLWRRVRRVRLERRWRTKSSKAGETGGSESGSKVPRGRGRQPKRSKNTNCSARVHRVHSARKDKRHGRLRAACAMQCQEMS